MTGSTARSQDQAMQIEEIVELAPLACLGAMPRAYGGGALLEFLIPGIVHALGNQVFAIQGCAHVLRDGKIGRRQRATILDAATAAEHALDVLRLLGPDDGLIERREQAGVLLARLAPLCRIPLRDRGLRLDIDRSCRGRPRVVDARVFARTVVDLLLRIATRLPAFVQGTLRLDLAEQDAVSVTLDASIELEPTCLPFPMDLGAVGTDLATAHDAAGVTAGMRGRALRVRVPLAW